MKRAEMLPVDENTPCCICGDALPWQKNTAMGMGFAISQMDFAEAGFFAGWAHKECREAAARILREEMIRRKVQEILEAKGA